MLGRVDWQPPFSDASHARTRSTPSLCVMVRYRLARRLCGIGRAFEIPDPGPVGELVEAAFGIIEVAVQVTRLGPDRLRDLVLVVTLAALVRVRNGVMDVVGNARGILP